MISILIGTQFTYLQHICCQIISEKYCLQLTNLVANYCFNETKIHLMKEIQMRKDIVEICNC